jgi:chorismate mutase
MTTLTELQAQVADLDQQITEQQQRLSELKSERAALARKVANWQEIAEGADRRKANRLARRWGVYWEDDSYREGGVYNHLHYFPKPDFLEGADPLTDGHYAYSWDETLWLVEFYAKHNPEHPDHEHREFLENSPWC